MFLCYLCVLRFPHLTVLNFRTGYRIQGYLLITVTEEIGESNHYADQRWWNIAHIASYTYSLIGSWSL